MNGRATTWALPAPTFTAGVDTEVISQPVSGGVWSFEGFSEIVVTVVCDRPGTLFAQIQDGADFIDVMKQASAPAKNRDVVIANKNVVFLVISPIPAPGRLRFVYVSSGGAINTITFAVSAAVPN